MMRKSGEIEIETGIERQELEIEEEEIAQKIKAGIEEEDFYTLGFERQKRLLRRIKFEEGETIRRVVHNVMERYGDVGIQLLKYVDIEAGFDEKSLIEIVGELESIPIIRECSKLINRLIESVENENKNGKEMGVDWEKQYKEEAKQRQTIEAELKAVKSKYEGVLSILQKRAPQEKEHSEREAKRIFEMFDKKDLKSLMKALSKDPSLIFVKNEKKQTLLHRGVGNEWIEGMEVVIEYGVGIEGFVDRVDHNSETPLIRASWNGNLDIVKFLISKGANIEAKDISGKTVLMEASEKGKLKVAEFLISKGANIEAKNNRGKTVLMEASRNGKLDIVKFLISKGANIEVKDEYGYTLLIKACERGDFEFAEFLISKGANIEARDKNEWTALIRASWNGNLDIVKFLISKGTNIEAKDNSGNTALMKASEKGNLEIVKFLISKGANIESKDISGETALMKASEKGNLEIVKILISKGANIEMKDFLFGYTALIKASEKGHLEIVKFLISKGANIEAKNNYGKTALMTASRKDKHEVVEFLKLKGAKE